MGVPPFVRVRIDPEDWYPFEMSLEVRPLPGFPENYVIACKRSRDERPPCNCHAAYNPDTRFGEWEQPITVDLFREIMRILDEARIPPRTTGAPPNMLDGPAQTRFVLELDGARFEWSSRDDRAGWEPLRQVVALMEEASRAPSPVDDRTAKEAQPIRERHSRLTSRTSRLFDAYVMVDWSAANGPRTGRDSIWIGIRKAGEEMTPPANPATREEATSQLQEALERFVSKGKRVLVGFDFPFGYPGGFANAFSRGDLEGCSPWRFTWDRLKAEIKDDAKNRNNRFDVARALNRQVGARWVAKMPT